MEPVDAITDKELVAEFVRLAQAARLSQGAAGGLVGVSQKTASEWWREIYRELQPDTRLALEAAVQRGRETGSVRETAGGNIASPNGDSGLSRQLNEVLARDGNEWAIGYLVGEIRAAYRDAALKDLAAALLKAEENAGLLSAERAGHRDAILRMDENALAMRQTGGPPPATLAEPVITEPGAGKKPRKRA